MALFLYDNRALNWLFDTVRLARRARYSYDK